MHAVVTADIARPRRVAQQPRVTVVGGGIAGAVAATVLAERGARVTLLERAPQLGGRLAAWRTTLPDGTSASVEHGFHAFFRQYYNLRAFLDRVDDGGDLLRPVRDYPVVSRAWPDESFARLPKRPPFNLLGLLLRSPSLPLSALRSMDREAATPMLSFDPVTTYERFDDVSATELLDALRLPDRARATLFEVFSHSFFNREHEMSAAEMLMQFHFYFLGNPEGLGFDAPIDDYETAIWSPLRRRLDAHDADVRTGAAATGLAAEGDGWRVATDTGDVVADHVVLALDVPSLRALVAGATGVPPQTAAAVDALQVTAPYAVARFWLDRDVAPRRPVFAGVTRERTLDSITVYSRLENEHRAWARRTGGSIVELHGYAVDDTDPAAVSAALFDDLAALWPEVREATVVHTERRTQHDAPGFALGSDRTRPGVDAGTPTLSFAGDWVRLPFPTALMERAAASGMLAANRVLAACGASPEPVASIRPRGLLAGTPLAR